MRFSHPSAVRSLPFGILGDSFFLACEEAVTFLTEEDFDRDFGLTVFLDKSNHIHLSNNKKECILAFYFFQ